MSMFSSVSVYNLIFSASLRAVFFGNPRHLPEVLTVSLAPIIALLLGPELLECASKGRVDWTRWWRRRAMMMLHPCCDTKGPLHVGIRARCTTLHEDRCMRSKRQEIMKKAEKKTEAYNNNKAGAVRRWKNSFDEVENSQEDQQHTYST